MKHCRLLCSTILLILVSCDRGPAPSGGEAGGGMMMQHSSASVDTSGLRQLEIPTDHQRGRTLYDNACAACHGEAGLGTQQGPPLVHIVYEPGHHADAAFLLAAQRGVRAHHWSFGDMPPQPSVTREEVEAITGYIRFLQREAGVY